MARDVIYCLMTSGLYLTEELARELYGVAVEMIRSGTRATKRTVRGDEWAGVVTTSFSVQTLGPMGGVRFNATVETERGTFQVHYLVDEDHLDGLEEGTWSISNPLGSHGGAPN